MATRALSTVNLDDLKKFAKLLHEIEPLVDKLIAAAAVLPQVLAAADKAVAVLPIEERFIRSGDVAKFLCISQADITKLVNAKLLTPYYTPNSSHRKFSLNEVKTLAKTKTWKVEK